MTNHFDVLLGLNSIRLLQQTVKLQINKLSYSGKINRYTCCKHIAYDNEFRHAGVVQCLHSGLVYCLQSTVV